MSDYVIGIDPDSKAHGVATYKNGKLVSLDNFPLMELMEYLCTLKKDAENISIHMEDVKANKAVWHGKSQSKKAYGMTSQNVAKCKHAQIEVERMIEHCFGLNILTLHKVSSKWKNQEGKREFMAVTNWEGRSNEDSRSAAYFGFLGLKRVNK